MIVCFANLNPCLFLNWLERGGGGGGGPITSAFHKAEDRFILAYLRKHFK